MNGCGTLAVCAALFAGVLFAGGERLWLDEMDLSTMYSANAGPGVRNRSIAGHPLRIGDVPFARGVGTHSYSRYIVAADGNALAFDAKVGVDWSVSLYDDGAKVASQVFKVIADGRTVARTPVLRWGRSPYTVHADLAGAKRVELVVEDADNGPRMDHADWCEAYFTVREGTKIVPEKLFSSDRLLGVLTPKPGPAPRLNGARILGARPGHEIIHRVSATGERPMRFSAANVPAGLAFDAEKGILRGSVAARGEYRVVLAAENARGSDRRELRIVVGDRIALTPPMGWNSWNCFAHAVTEKNIRDTIRVLSESELANHGWNYVNIDDYWQNRPGETNDVTLAGPERLPDGTIAVNRRFGDMKALAEFAHSKGLRIGLYSSPGPLTCGGCTGSWKHEWQDARTYADWGFDYLKYDWCGYSRVTASVATGHHAYTLPYRLMGEALGAQKRDIVFSICQYGMGEVHTWGANVGGNCWRTTFDIKDSWLSMSGILEQQAELWPYARPGEWNDPDMLVVGKLGWGKLHPSELVTNEQYTHMSFWCILCSPLLIGCDMTDLDEFTTALLTNDEVLETNQDPLGAQAARVDRGPGWQVWAKPMEDGSFVFALYSDDYGTVDVSVDFAKIGLLGSWQVRDLWRQQDLGIYSKRFTARVQPHATTLVRMRPADADARMKPCLGDIRNNATYIQFEKVRPVDKPGRSVPARDGKCARCPER